VAEDRLDGRLVVCGLTGSSADASAVDVAAQLARLVRAELALVAVAPVPVRAAREYGVPEWTLEEARRALELTADTLAGRVAVGCYLDSGNPVRRLAEFAARKDALLLVVGTRAPANARPPSIVASGIARAAPCPLVVVPEAAPVPDLDAGRPDE
jgi:nucleotide-binding universal stress UspA family protein